MKLLRYPEDRCSLAHTLMVLAVQFCDRIPAELR